MTSVVAKDGESVEALLRRFKRKVEASGILKDVRKKEYYVKPSVRKNLKQIAAAKQRKRAEAKRNRPTQDKQGK